MILVCIITSAGRGQSLYQRETNQRKSLYDSPETKDTGTADPHHEIRSLSPQPEKEKNSKAETEVFGVHVERTMYGVNFNKNNIKLTPVLHEKLEKYLQNTRHPGFRKIGTFVIDIIKKDGRYFIVIDESFNKWEEL